MANDHDSFIPGHLLHHALGSVLVNATATAIVIMSPLVLYKKNRTGGYGSGR